MTLETFFDKFNQFADAPDAVAKIRELILESAIRGNLVQQNTNDEPVSELLKRTEALRSSSVQAGKIRKQAALPPVGDDAYLHIPPGWEWTRLGTTGQIFNGDSVNESGKMELAKVANGLPFIATKDVGYGRDTLVYDNGLKVPAGDPRFKVARANAVLICAEGGSAGRKIGITDRDICFGNKLYANEVWLGIHHRYIFYVYQAPAFYREFAARMTGIIGGIARSEFLSLPIPLPPEDEQKRIVAKVDELMALCDRLEAQQQERETRHAALARASLARFADAPTPANLPFLFHPFYTIPPADLRKSILTLAVQGKLVPQDPSDEPTSELLPRLERYKQKNPNEDGRKSRDTPDSTAENSDYPIPASWSWARLSTIALRINDGNYGESYPTKSELLDAGIPFLTSASILPDGSIDRANLKYISSEKQAELTKAQIIPGDVIFPNRGARGGQLKGSEPIAVVVPDWLVDGNVNPQVTRIRLHPDFYLNYFLCAVLRTPLFLDQFESATGGTALPFINLTKTKAFTVPVPPLAEQRRIVAKVEQLMALVDALEKQLAASRTTAANLLSALVAELTNPMPSAARQQKAA